MTRIVVCAENSVTRVGLTAMATTAATQVVGQAACLGDLNTWLQTQSADVAVVELSALTPEVARDLMQITAAWPSADSLSILLLLETWENHRLLTPVMSTGGVSILPVTVSADQIKGAIATLAIGLMVLHPEIAETLSAPIGSAFTPVESFPEPSLEPLTPREIEVLNQLAAGLSNKAIATTLAISEHTVKFHISAILSKLGASSRTEAVAVGIRAGLVML